MLCTGEEGKVRQDVEDAAVVMQRRLVVDLCCVNQREARIGGETVR